MKPYTSFQNEEENTMTGIDQDICVFRGNPDLVDFPSAAEIFRAVFENSFYANYITNGQGRTLEANERACKIFDYASKEMVGLSSNDLFAITKPNYFQYITMRKSQRRVKSIITGIRRNGDHFPCEITSVVFFDDKGEKRIINTIQDLSKNYSKKFPV